MVTLRRVEAGLYQTVDGRYEIQKDVIENECQEPHPARVSGRARSYYAQHKVRPQWIGPDEWTAIALGQKGYFCTGDYHAEEVWQAWDKETEDYVGGHGVTVFRTKKEAVEYLNDFLERQ